MRTRILKMALVAGPLAACSPSRDVLSQCVIAVDASAPGADGGYSISLPPGFTPDGSIVGYLPDGAFDPNLNPADYSTCPQPVRCVDFAAVAQDGICHAVGLLCVVPCQTNADCAVLGANSVCSTECADAGHGTGVCTPVQ